MSTLHTLVITPQLSALGHKDGADTRIPALCKQCMVDLIGLNVWLLSGGPIQNNYVALSVEKKCSDQYAVVNNI